MFLDFFKSLYKKQPKLFYLFGSFFILQIFFVLLKLEVTPFFLYGMFSENVPPTHTFSETEVVIDGKELQSWELSYKEKMLLEETVKKYVLIKNNNGIDIVQTRVEERYPFFTNSTIYPFLKEKIYNQPLDLAQFEHWLKEKCSRISHRKVQQVNIVVHTYETNSGLTTVKKTHSETVASF